MASHGLRKLEQAEFFDKSSALGWRSSKDDLFFIKYQSLNTQNSYYQHVDLFYDFVSKLFKTVGHPFRHPAQISVEFGVRYRQYLELEGLRNTSIGSKIACLREYFQFLKEQRIVENNPFIGVKVKGQNPKDATNELSDKQVNQLLIATSDDNLMNSLHRAILYTLFYTGMRKSSLITLCFEDLSIKQGKKVLNYMAKGSKFASSVLHPKVVKAIDIYLGWMELSGRKLAKEDPLFQPSRNMYGKSCKHLDSSTINKILRRYALKAGITDRISPHSARATFIGHLWEKGVEMRTIADEVDHKDTQMTEKYIKRRKQFLGSPTRLVDYGD